MELAPALSFSRPLLALGYLGVDLFFVLSGFILSFNYLQTFSEGVAVRQWLHFLRLRLARIYPVHLVTLHLAVGLYAAALISGVNVGDDGTIRYSVSAYIENVTLTQAWFSDTLSWNSAAWTISAEWAAYMAFPLLAAVVSRARTATRAWIGVIVCYSVWLVVVRTVYWDSTNALAGALPRVALQFLAGCFLYLVYRARPTSKVPLVTAAVASVTIGAYAQPWQGFRAWVLTPFFGLLVLGLAQGGSAGRVLRSRIAVLGGEVSYSLYLSHQLVGSALGRTLPTEELATRSVAVRTSLVVIYLVAPVVTAALFYVLVERPGRELLAAKGRRRSTPR